MGLGGRLEVYKRRKAEVQRRKYHDCMMEGKDTSMSGMLALTLCCDSLPIPNLNPVFVTAISMYVSPIMRRLRVS
jgi:hypothetical protein